MDEIQQLIAELDVPGKQVLIQAIIIEIEHTKVTSLGIELATNPQAFGSLSENAITALANITNVGTHGSPAGRISSGAGTMNATGSGTVLGVGTDVYALIDFLIKTTNARILNQQSLWTKDNEEASFFKGSEVAFIAGSTTAASVGTTQNITFEPVGMELRARPSITPEDKVDMVVNVQISQLTSEIVNAQPVRSKMNTTTNMIVQDGQTLLLGGILFQKDSLVQRKLPGLGDLPGVGGLFRHKEVIKSNSEMLVFMTPRVIDENMENVSEATKAVINQPTETLKKALGELDTGLKGLDQ
jgi:general secretion pathway protein D